MKVYLDNCSFNRPFDEQRQARVRLEAEAKLCIQREIRDGRLELAWSYILDFENAANPFEERRTAIAAWRETASVYVEESKIIVEKAKIIAATGMKAKDALPLACAISAECDCFITTDDRVLRLANNLQEIAVVDPTTFVRETNL